MDTHTHTHTFCTFVVIYGIMYMCL